MSRPDCAGPSVYQLASISGSFVIPIARATRGLLKKQESVERTSSRIWSRPSGLLKSPLRIATSESGWGASLSTHRWFKNPGAGQVGRLRGVRCISGGYRKKLGHDKKPAWPNSNKHSANTAPADARE